MGMMPQTLLAAMQQAPHHTFSTTASNVTGQLHLPAAHSLTVDSRHAFGSMTDECQALVSITMNK